MNIIREVLQEYSSDQRLPFDDDYFKNKNYLEQYTDWLEDFGKYGTLPPSKFNFWSGMEKAVEKYINEEEDSDYEMNYDKNDLLDKLYNNISDYLNFNEDGNLYVERKLKIKGKSSDYDESYNGKDTKMFYRHLVNNYENSVGGCWSFKRGASYAYCSNEEGDTITLKGYIRTDDIDFYSTYILSLAQLDEYEIRVKPNAKVELIEADFNGEHKIPLKGHLIVNSTYFGNNNGYKGDYATAYYGIGDYKYIDRSGNIVNLDDEIRKKVKARQYEIEDEFSNGYSVVYVSRADKYALIDSNNNIVNTNVLWFDNCINFYKDIWVCERDDKILLIKSKGNLLCNGLIWFDDILNFNEKFAIVDLNEYYSFIDEEGVLIGNGNLWFDAIYRQFNNGFAIIGLNNKMYWLDTEGNFYDYESGKPIPNPIESTNENKKYIKNIIKEAINNYLNNNLIK